MASTQTYDLIDRGYTATCRADRRIAAIWRALRDARTVLNVGAGYVAGREGSTARGAA